MRLYRFLNDDRTIDVTVVTDGSCDQKRVFITESPRGIVAAGQVLGENEPNLGEKLQAMGFNWKAGEQVNHEELVAFAENNGLELIVDPQGLNEIVSVNGEWNGDDVCVLNIVTTIPAKKKVEVHFPNTVTLNDTVKRYGEIRGDRKTLVTSILSNHPLEFSLDDLGLADMEDLNVVVMADDEVQKFEITVEIA